MVADAEAGWPVDRGGGRFTLAEMKAWAEERTIRAAVLRHLLVDGQWPVSARGVQLRSVRISGHLDLKAEALRCPLSLDCCYFDGDEPVCLDNASASRLILTRCQLPGLSGEMLAVKEFDLSDSTLTGPLQLSSADVAGRLSCRNAHLTGTDSGNNALFADWMKVGGGVFLDEGFTAAGAVRLPGADITGPLSCHGARLTGTNRDGNALHADWMKVGGGVFLDKGFSAAGTISLVAAHTGASVYLMPAALASEKEVALNAARVQIEDTLRWKPTVQVLGQVNLEGATVGQLEDVWSSERPNGF